MKIKIKNRIHNYIYDIVTDYFNDELCKMITNEFKEYNVTFKHYKKLKYTEIIVDNKRVLLYKWDNIIFNLFYFEGYKKVITKSINYKNII